MTFDEIKEKLSRFRVGIAGAGGLGSNCAVALARSGVGTLVIADFDIVEERNLNRQYFFLDQTGMKKVTALSENLSRISGTTKVIAHDTILTPENIPVIYKGCNIIVEAFDRSDMKQMLIETVSIQMPGIPLIVGSGLAGWGSNETIGSRKIDETLYICGDEAMEVGEQLPQIGRAHV